MPSASRITIALVGAGAFAFACSPRSHSEAAPAIATAGPVVALQAAPRRSSGQRLSTTFDVKLQEDGVNFALRVTNATKKHVELTFPNGQTHEFVVVDSAGREVWRWGTTRMFTQSVQNKLLGGGESMRISERWERPVQHGRYTAIATLTSTNFPVEERADFVLP